MSDAKRRGRPRNEANPKIAEHDRIIAMTVYQLACWGLPLRTGSDSPGIFEAVGLQACSVLQRSDSNRRALGPDRVEQIFEAWFKKEQALRLSRRQWPLKERWRYTKESLGESIPDKRMNVCQLAEELLKNKGRWVRPGPTLSHGDLILSPKAYRAIGPTPKFIENGVEK